MTGADKVPVIFFFRESGYAPKNAMRFVGETKNLAGVWLILKKTFLYSFREAAFPTIAARPYSKGLPLK